MRKLRVLTVLAVIGVSACAERMVNPAVVPEPPLKAAPKPQPKMEARRQSERIAEDTRKRSAVRSRQVSPSAGVEAEQSPEPETPLQASQQSRVAPVMGEAVALLPPPTEPDDSNFPFAALMPPPAEPAEPTFPSVPPTGELPHPSAPTLPEVPMEAAMPTPPEPAEPSFPVAALMPSPPEPAEPSLPSREEIVAEGAVPIPYPDLPSYLAMRPRLAWEDVTGSFEVLRSPLSPAFEVSPERQLPTLVQNPWPLPLEDGPK